MSGTKINQHLKYRGSYNTVTLIEEHFPSISHERLDEMNDSAKLTDGELEALHNGISAKDDSCWELHSGFYFKVRFGTLNALFVGHDMVQGGSDFELEGIYKSQKLALEHVSSKPRAALDITS